MAAETIERTAFRKVIWRLMPLLTIAYILNYLDRSNIGFAALQMNHQLGLTAAQFGVGAGILSLGYCAFEIASNLALYRFGGRIWIARIMITWGLVAAGCALIRGPTSLYSIRFLLGLTEAGFLPGRRLPAVGMVPRRVSRPHAGDPAAGGAGVLGRRRSGLGRAARA